MNEIEGRNNTESAMNRNDNTHEMLSFIFLMTKNTHALSHHNDFYYSIVNCIVKINEYPNTTKHLFVRRGNTIKNFFKRATIYLTSIVNQQKINEMK